MVPIFWKIEATGEDFDGYIKTFMAFNRVGKQLSLEREKEPVTFPLHSNVNLREQLDWSYPKKKKKKRFLQETFQK